MNFQKWELFSGSPGILKADVLELGMADHYLVYGMRKVNAWRVKNKKPKVLETRCLSKRKHPQMGRNIFRIEVQNCGIDSQPRPNRHPPLLSSNRLFDGLGDFSCGRVASRGPRSLCLIAAGSAMEICFQDLRCRFGWVGRGDRGCPGFLIVGEAPSLLVLFTFLSLLKIRITFSLVYLL